MAKIAEGGPLPLDQIAFKILKEGNATVRVVCPVGWGLGPLDPFIPPSTPTHPPTHLNRT